MAARRNVSVCLTLGRLTLGRAVERTPITSSLEAGRIRDAVWRSLDSGELTIQANGQPAGGTAGATRAVIAHLN